ncbi:MAG: TonB family protein [Acidobacteriota bacterium]
MSQEDKHDLSAAEEVATRQHTATENAGDELVDLFLKESDPKPAKISFIITSFLFIGLFLAVFPKGEKPVFEEIVIDVPFIDDYVPPVKEPPKQQKIEKQKVKKVALPDPTPEEPEPLIEPPPEPEPEPLPPNVKVRKGVPRGPPQKRGTGPVREGTAGLINPKIIKEPQPRYPDLAKRAGLEGTVIVQALIGKDGKVKRAKLLKGLGRFGIDEAAIDAVERRIYEPGRLEGKPVEVLSTVRVQFKLR